jgi:hypothetical protein
MKVDKKLLTESWKEALTDLVLENAEIIDKSETITLINESVTFDKVKDYIKEDAGDDAFGSAISSANKNLKDLQNKDKFKKGALGTAAVTALISVAIYAFKKFGTKANRSCNKLSGKERQVCKLKFSIQGCQAAIKLLTAKKVKCKKAKDPKKCNARINKKIVEYRTRMAKYKTKLKTYK